MKTTLSALAILAFAGPALAGGCNYGKSEMTMAHSEPAAEAPAVSTPAEPMVVATVDCSTLTGDAQAACLATAN